MEFGDPIFSVTDENLGTPLLSGGWRISVGGEAAYIDNVKVVGLLDEIPLQGLSLNKTKLELRSGRSEQLTVSYTPASTTDSKDVTWTSSDTSVATVENGLVTAIKEGTATISVTSQKKNITASCEVTVLPPKAEGAILYQDDFEGGPLNDAWKIEGGEGTLEEKITGKALYIKPSPASWKARAMIEPDNPDEWKNYSIQMDFMKGEALTPGEDYTNPSWNPGGVYDNISIEGRISENGADNWAVIIRTKTNKIEINKFYANSTQTWKQETDLTLKEDQIYSLKLDFDENTISAYLAEKGEEFGNPIFSVTDENLGTPLLSGGWGISVGGEAAYIDNVKVVGLLDKIPLQELALSASNMQLACGETEQLFVNYTPNNTSFKDVKWTSSNTSVATVEDGVVTAVGAGIATITVTSVEKETITASCEVEVYEKLACKTFYYVAPNGDDSNDGTKGRPFKTLEKAREAVRSLNEIPDGGVTVYLREGIYSIEETFVLTPEDSGRLGSPVVYASYPGEQAVISGGSKIEGWTLADDKTEDIAEAAKGNVYVADVERGWRFHDLYVNGQRMDPAGNQDGKDWTQWLKFSWGEYGSPGPNGLEVIFENGELNGLGGKDIELNLVTANWWNTIAVVKDIDETRNTANLHSKNPTFNVGNSNYGLFWGQGNYEILNALKYLDSPNEWVVDSGAGKVYFWPSEGVNLETAAVIAPKPYELIRFEGDGESEDWAEQVKYVELRDLVIEYADRMPEDQWPDEWVMRNAENPDAAVFMQGVTGCAVEGCVIRHTGAYAITLNQWAQNNRILDNEMGDLGCGGIQLLGYGPGTKDLNHHNRASYNYIHDIGRSGYWHSSAITAYESGDNVFTYNKMENMPYTVVMICGAYYLELNGTYKLCYCDSYANFQNQYKIRWDELGNNTELTRETCRNYLHSDNNYFAYNICEEYMQIMNDGGALYAWSTGLGNEFSYNLVKKTTPAKHMTWPLYMDDVVDGAVLIGNRIWGTFAKILDKSVEPNKNTYVDNEFSDEKSQKYGELEQQILERVQEAVGEYRTALETDYSCLHTHIWSDEWSNDATHHWHNCTAANCPVTENSEKAGYGAHVYDNDQDTTCNTCLYERTVTTGPSPKPTPDPKPDTKPDPKPGNTAPFRDVHESDWYSDAVEYVYEKGLMNGTGKNTFSPNSQTTRGMIVTILYRQSGSPDVNSDNKTWWSDARVWAMECGISDGTNMDGNITREQLAAMLYRYAKLTGADVSAKGNLNKFTDRAKISDWATEAVQWAVGEGIIGGRPNGTLDPKGLATRAEVAAMLMRFGKEIG